MKKRNIFISFIIIILFAACSQKQSEIKEPKFKESPSQDRQNYHNGIQTREQYTTEVDSKYEDEDDFHIEIIDDEGNEFVIIKKYVGEKTDIVIPPEIQKLPVAAIGNNAFEGLVLTSVSIPDSVTIIGEEAFAKNQLTSINIPDNVIRIGAGAFWGNQLTDVTIGKNVTAIGNKAFFDNHLTSISIPDSVISIGNENMQNILYLFEPVKTGSIGAFANNNISEVKLGKNVILVGDEAFAFNQLINITLPDSVMYIGAGALIKNQLENIIIPDNVIYIGNGAFAYNQLINVNIPKSLDRIRDSVFKHNKLKNITIPKNITIIDEIAFMNNSLIEIIIPANVEAIRIGAFKNNQITSISIEGEYINLGEFDYYSGKHSFAFDNGFDDSYRANDMKPGVYIYRNKRWRHRN